MARSRKVAEQESQVEDEDLTPFLDKVIRGNCLEVLPKMPSNCVDMVFFDPPYFLQLPAKKRLIRWDVRTIVEGVNDEWDRFASFEEYDAFLRSSLHEIRRVMKPQATIWTIGTYHNTFRMGTILQDLGFWILNDVIWVKTNPMPNWLNVRFTNGTETLIWAVRNKEAKQYTFNKEIAREYSESKITSNYWRIPLCTGKERLKDESGKKLHSTQKPEKLLERIVRISSSKDDIILDPVAGTGTTGYIAKKYGRHFIMIDANNEYVNAANNRLLKVQYGMDGD